MSEEIFISYKSELRAAAQHFATVLRHHGFSVWFDYSLVKGRDFGLQIDSRIRAAKALVVLWCSKAVGSRWVIEEVDLAHHLGILIPVKIEACELPTGFRRVDYINLSEWDGNPRGHQVDPLIDELEKRIGHPAVIDRAAIRHYENNWRMFGEPSLRAFGLGQPMEAVEAPRFPTAEPIVVAGNVFYQHSVTIEKPAAVSGNPLAAGGYEEKEKRLIRTLEENWSYVLAVALAADGRTVVSGSDDKTVKL